jgi:glycosyltransferase involved in cell wall biosynthesis
MKILIVSDAWEPQVNGVVRTLKMTCREAALQGHTVDVLSPLGHRSLPCPTYPEIRLSLTTPAAMARRIEAIAPDCLHIATEGPLGWCARRAALRRGWRFTTAYHSRFPQYLRARFGLPVAWSYAALRRFHNAGEATLVPTPTMAAELTTQGFARPRLWSRGVDLAMFTPDGEREPRGRAPVFLYVGRLAVEKQVEAFLDLPLPGEKWVAGEGPSRERLRAAHPEARWFGVLNGPELARIYRSADVLVFPSLTDTFGLVMVEAMACGTPVAAFPVIGPIDVVGPDSPGGVLHADLRQACLQALSLPRDAVRRFAERYAWQDATRQFIDALQPMRGTGRTRAASDMAVNVR